MSDINLTLYLSSLISGLAILTFLIFVERKRGLVFLAEGDNSNIIPGIVALYVALFVPHINLFVTVTLIGVLIAWVFYHFTKFILKDNNE